MYGLTFLLVENVNNTYCVVFTSKKELDLAAARKFALPLVRDFMPLRCPMQDEPQPRKLALKIAFWDNNVNRPKSPDLAEIFFSEGTFYFYEADALTQSLILVGKESYEETVKKTKYQSTSFDRNVL